MKNIFIFKGVEANLPPVFTKDMNHLALSENTPVGHVVYKIEGHDPEGLPVSLLFIFLEKYVVSLY